MLLLQFVIYYYLVSCINPCKAELTWNDCTHIATPNGTCFASSSISCNTLDYFAQNASVYFQSNTVLCFMSGRHVINITTVITIIGTSNITLIGFGNPVQRSVNDKAKQFNFTATSQDENITFLEPATIIECINTDSGILFNTITNLSLINLTFVNCGANSTETLSFLQPNPISYVAVLMINVSNLHIEATSIQNSRTAQDTASLG